jgi:predicted permease
VLLGRFTLFYSTQFPHLFQFPKMPNFLPSIILLFALSSLANARAFDPTAREFEFEPSASGFLVNGHFQNAGIDQEFWFVVSLSKLAYLFQRNK